MNMDLLVNGSWYREKKNMGKLVDRCKLCDLKGLVDKREDIEVCKMVMCGVDSCIWVKE